MHKVRLEEVSERGSSNLSQKDIEGLDGNYPIYGASGYIGNINFYHQGKDYIAVVKDGAGIGRTMFLPAKSSVIGTLQYIIPNERVLPKYLYYAVKHMNLSRYYTGATIPHIYYKDYKNEVFWLPDMPKQQEIVHILEKVEKILEEHQQELLDLDKMVKSRFVEMFGDPIVNDKGFKTIAGKDFFKLSNGKAVPEEKRTLKGIPAWGGNGISGYTDQVLFKDNTLVVGRVGFQSGNVHLAKGPLWITDNAMYISDFYVNDCDLIYLCTLMGHIDFTRYQDAGDLKKITQKPFMEMNFVFPPIKLQNQFATFVHQVDKLKVAQQKRLEQTQILFDSLMQQYFG